MIREGIDSLLVTPHSPPFNAQERDIDLLLLEEIHCSPAFLSWIAARAGLVEGTLFSAQHSVYRDNGETDVLVLIDTPDGRVALMIEDKIGAEMQPRQAERYRERGKKLCDEGSALHFRTLLCAPRNYLEGVPPQDWHTTLPFEEIADWFGKQDDSRAKWRRDTLVRAVDRQRRSTATFAVGDETLIRFKQDYQRYVRRVHPEFVLTTQTGRDREYYFKEVNFPAHIRLKHSFTASAMVLVFEQHWKEKALKVQSDSIPDNMQIENHPNTLHLVTGVEPVDLTEPVKNQTDLIDSAIEAARRLLPYALMVQQMSDT
jgi:hypothetical protein